MWWEAPGLSWALHKLRPHLMHVILKGRPAPFVSWLEAEGSQNHSSDSGGHLHTCRHSLITPAGTELRHERPCPLLEEARWNTGGNPKPLPLWLPRLQLSRRHCVPSLGPHLFVEGWAGPLPQFIFSISGWLPKFLSGTRRVAASDLYCKLWLSPSPRLFFAQDTFVQIRRWPFMWEWRCGQTKGPLGRWSGAGLKVRLAPGGHWCKAQPVPLQQ